MGRRNILRHSLRWRSEFETLLSLSSISPNLNSSEVLLFLICFFNEKLRNYFNRFDIFIDNNFNLNGDKAVIPVITMMLKSISKTGLISSKKDIFESKFL